MAKLTIPTKKQITGMEPGSAAKAAKEAKAVSASMYRVPVDKIKPIPGFNVRVDSEDYIAHRDMLVNSIAQNGFDETKPLAGYVAKEGEHNVVYVTDGYTRLDAVNTFNSDPDTKAEDEIEMLPVIIRKEVPTMADLTVALHTNNSGRPLTPFELGIVVKRLLAEPEADKNVIAARLSVTPRYLDDVLLLADSPPKLRNIVLAGEFSSTAAIQELRRNPEEAADRVAAAVAKAKGTGKKKATAKDVGPKMVKFVETLDIESGGDMKELVKLAAGVIRGAVPANEDGDVKLATTMGTVTITVEIEAPPAEPKPAKAKPAAKKPAAKKAPAKKPAAKKAAPAKAKPAAKKPAAKKPAAKKAAPAADLGIEGAEAVEDEALDIPSPPAVKGDATGNDDNI